MVAQLAAKIFCFTWSCVVGSIPLILNFPFILYQPFLAISFLNLGSKSLPPFSLCLFFALSLNADFILYYTLNSKQYFIVLEY